MRCLIVHGDGAKTVGYEAQYVLFAASDEQDVAANGQLLEAKDVIVGLFAGKQEAESGKGR